jgi:hypothetical protein
VSDGKLIGAGRERLAKVREPDPADPAARDPAAQPTATEPASPAPGLPPGGPAEHWPVHLERREPEMPLNVNVPWSVRHGIRLLAMRKGTDQKAEVAEALRAWFAAEGFAPPSFWDHPA